MNLEKAMKIVKDNSDVFYFKDEEVKDKTFRIFNYRLGSYSDFLPEGAEELRGLTIELDTGKVWYSLHKFFNNNENPFTMDEHEKWNTDDEIEVTEKLDGSLIQLILIDDYVRVKTKGTFNSEQAMNAQMLLDNEPELKVILKGLIEEGYFPLMEYISPFNQIVVDYDKSELKILQIRDKDGNYMDYDFIISRVPEKYVTKKYNYSLKELEELQETVTGLEGWVVRNKSDKNRKTQFRKFKTEWYFALHHLMSPNELVENKLIEHIVNETIDDIMSNLKGDKFKKVEEVRDLVSHDFNHKLKRAIELLKEKESMDRKDFAIKHKKEFFFGAIMKSRNEDELVENCKEFYIKRYDKLNKARELISELKGKK